MIQNPQINILGLGQFSSNVEFYVNTLSSHLQSSHHHISKPHKHDFYATILFTNGHGLHEVDFKSYKVSPGAIFTLQPGQTHSWQLSDDCDGMIFFHTQNFYDTFYIDLRVRDYLFFSVNQEAMIQVDDEELLRLKLLFGQLYAENLSAKPYAKEMVLNLITQIYIALSRQVVNHPAHISTQMGYYHKFKKFEHLVDAHFWTDKSVSQYASWLNMTPKHLNRITQHTIGKAPSEIIVERVILESKRMLIYAKGSLNEVAFALGYADYPHFSRIFKNKTGQTPSQFARQYN